MLTLLLATTLSTQTIPTTTVHFPGGYSFTVSGPGSDAERLIYGETSAWVNNATLYSPKKDLAAVRFCINHTKEFGCIVYLVKSSGRIQELKNSDVTPLIWTKDGKYLIGAGVNTVRIWNLSGEVSLATPMPPITDPGITQSSSEITRLWLDAGNLCVAIRTRWSSGQGQQSAIVQQTNPAPQTPGSQKQSTTVTTTRYALPLLKPLTSATFPVSQKLQEAQCQRVRRSD